MNDKPKREFKGVWIPRELWDAKDISLTEIDHLELSQHSSGFFYLSLGGYRLINKEQGLLIAKELLKTYEQKQDVITPLRKKLIDELNRYLRTPIQQTKQQILDVSKKGYIYFLRADKNVIKIGRTKNINNRTKELKPKLPFKQTTIVKSLIFKDCILAEKLIHESFSESHINGEWYSIPDKTIENIPNIFSREIKDLILHERPSDEQ